MGWWEVLGGRNFEAAQKDLESLDPAGEYHPADYELSGARLWFKSGKSTQRRPLPGTVVSWILFRESEFRDRLRGLNSGHLRSKGWKNLAATLFAGGNDPSDPVSNNEYLELLWKVADDDDFWTNFKKEVDDQIADGTAHPAVTKVRIFVFAMDAVLKRVFRILRLKSSL